MESVVIDPLTYANGTAVAEVEVDIDTGGVRIGSWSSCTTAGAFFIRRWWTDN
jgi:CO/xanthine dehydrogenase Mo-binding subunit